MTTYDFPYPTEAIRIPSSGIDRKHSKYMLQCKRYGNEQALK